MPFIYDNTTQLTELKFNNYPLFKNQQVIQINMSQYDSDDNTKQNLGDSLNNARINSPSSVLSTPSTRNARNKRFAMKSISREQSDSQSNYQWRMLLTKSIKQVVELTPDKKEQLTHSLKKNIQKTAQIKNKKGCSYQNMCPICLNKFNQIKGSLECLHQFCFTCISEWSKTSTICPCCRRPFGSILKLVGSLTTPNIRQIQRVSVQAKELVVNTQYDYYTCYQCGLGDNQHVLLICDQCDFYCCHVYCDPHLSNQVPQGDWFCLYCRGNKIQNNKEEQQNAQQEQEQSDREQSPNKYVAHRTRSRQSNYNFRSRLTIFRNFRRGR